MNLDVNSRFSYNPGTRAVRSRFDLGHTVKTSFDVGQLIPFYLEEVLPGDTHKIETNLLARMQTLKTPMMDDLFLDVFYFFVPNRILWDHWKNFMGENTQSAWYPETEYTMPQISVAPQKTVAPKTVADYFGIPTITVPSGGDFTFNALPFRAYGMIWNEWFRDENLQDPVLVDTGDTTRQYDPASAVDGGAVLNANKYHDYFTSSLPSPQKGPDVTLNIASGIVPVVARPQTHDNGGEFDPAYASIGMSFTRVDGTAFDSGFQYNLNFLGDGTSESGYLRGVKSSVQTGQSGNIYPNNLYAAFDMSGGIPVTTINSLRLAFATQRLYEKDARGGTRYREIIRSHFNTISPDARQQVPELLGYNRIPIQINQVVQNSSSVDDSPQGNTAAYSLTADSDNSFTKSFTEHGMIIGLCCARYRHSYQQGLRRLWSRKTRFDFYWPVFANLGEQPVLNKEIYSQGNDEDDEVFGYQEAWAEYRYHPDSVTSEMRSTYAQSLDVWHLGDDYSQLPILSPTWIQEDKANVDRVLAITSQNSNQIFADIYVKNIATRPMPMFSIPGLSENL